MKVAIVGAGHWGKNLIRVFCEILGEENVTVCDLDRERLKAIEGRHPHAVLTEDFDAVLAGQDVEAIAIATPAVTHFELAKQALLAGKHVLVEKPIALHIDEAIELIQLAREADRTLMVDHLLEYHPAVEELKRRIDSGELGEIYHLYNQRLNLGIVRTEENALWSLGPHDISVFLYLLEQEPLRVSAYGGAYLQGGIEDVVFVNLEFPDGVIAHAHLSWLDPCKARRITVVGSQRMMVFDDTAQEELTLFDRRVERAEGNLQLHAGEARAIVLKSEEPLKRMARHFLESIRDSTTPRSDGQDGLRVLRVLTAAQRSLEKGGKPVKLEG